MTNGTSQGLYVIVAVVIFGIFVGISYLIFQDSLKPKLMSIFETSTQEDLKNTIGYKPLETAVSYSKIENTENNVYTLSKEKEPDYWGLDGVVGLKYSKNKEVLVDFGQTLEIRFEVMPSKDTYAIVDYNALQLAGQESFSTGATNNDMYGDHDSNAGKSKKKVAVKKDVWSKISFEFTNNHINNVNKYTLRNESSFGIANSYFDTEDFFKIRNIEYIVYTK